MKLFHSFRLDTVNHFLWHDNERVSLTPKAFDVLRYLVERAGRVVTPDALLEAVWPETYVNPEVIKKYILEIRRALGDQIEEPLFIQTVHKRGYRFVAEVSEEGEISGQTAPKDAQKIVVGREQALYELDRCLERGLQSQRQLVFVTGEAGIGKTTLTDMFHQHAARRKDLRAARGQCVEGFGGKEPYYPILEALGQLVRSANDKSLLETLARYAPTWLVQFPALLSAELREKLEQETLGTTRERMLREICELLEILAKDHPLLLILEDLHWADPSTLDVISAFSRGRTPCRLLILGTYRPADVVLSQSSLKQLKQDLLLHQLCREISLESLEEAAVAKYLQVRFTSSRLPPEVSKSVLRHSGGNPLFMTATVEEMIKDRIVCDDSGSWTLARPVETIDQSLPQTLQQMLQGQFERLAAEEQAVLRYASVAGEHFSVWAVSAALEMDPARVESICEALTNRQQFIRSAGAWEISDSILSASYEFRHSLYRQSVYRGLPEATRLRTHRSLAERLKTLETRVHSDLTAEIASHLEAGHDFEGAVRYLMLAAKNSARRFGYRDSIHALQHALGLLSHVNSIGGAELETQVLEIIGDAHYALGAMAESVRAYEGAVAKAEHAGLPAAQVAALSSLVRPLGLIDPDRGIAAVDQAARLSNTVENPVLLARTQMLAAGIRLMYDGWNHQTAKLCDTSYEALGALGDSATPSFHQMIYAHVQVIEGRYEKAFQMFQVAENNIDDSRSLMAHFFALSGRTVALLRLGRWGELLQLVRSGRELAMKNAADPWLFNFREAWLRTLAYDYDGALRLRDTILNSQTKYPTEQPKTIAMVAAGYAALNRKNFSQAIECFREVVDPQRTAKFFLHWYWRMIAQLGLSRVGLMTGDLAMANEEADRFFTSALSTDDPHLQALAFEARMRVASAQRNYKDAEALLRKGLAIVSAFEVPVAALQLHLAAWDLYSHHLPNDNLASQHRDHARALVAGLASSFHPDEPLRATFLGAEAIAPLLSEQPLQCASATHSARHF